ncbi:MAG TPA: Os1348 family NHLP clan protein [Ktedonobacteraceae bacterium]|nr:Os1348 family NHLP clan protein [Ktedonobacteraceae bacterium]
MSWKTINEIIALASLDPAFREALQRDPVTAAQAQGFELTSEEQSVFQAFASRTLVEFCQGVLERLASPSSREE